MLLDNSYNTLYRGYGCTLKFEVAEYSMEFFCIT